MFWFLNEPNVLDFDVIEFELFDFQQKYKFIKHLVLIINKSPTISETLCLARPRNLFNKSPKNILLNPVKEISGGNTIIFFIRKCSNLHFCKVLLFTNLTFSLHEQFS